jgi:hypothetical protein
MKAFWIDAGYHDYIEEYIGGYPRYESAWFGGLVYAKTPAQAKHLFIQEHSGDFEYTDKMSIRVLATETDEKWAAGWVGYEDAEEGECLWMRGKRSKLGNEHYQEWLNYQAYLANPELQKEF